MNQWTGIGRLTRDPEIRRTKDGKKTASFTLAVDDMNTTDFINCVAWEKKADFAETYLRKGVKIAVVGKLRVRSWEKAGEKRTAPEISVASMEFCESRRTEDATEESAELTNNDLPF